MGRIAAITLLLLLSATPGRANVDELKRSLASAAGSDRVPILNQLAEAVRDNSPGDSRDWAEQALQLAQQLGDEAGTAHALNNLGVASYYLSDYEGALRYYERSIELSGRLGLEELYANSVNNIGIIHYIRGDYNRALDYYSQSLELRRKLGDRSGLAKSYNNLGNVYYSAGRYEESLEYYAESILMYEELGNDALVASSLNNIALVYQAMEEHDQALLRLRRALVLTERISHRPTMAMTLNNLGNIAEEQGNPTEALEFHQRSLDVRRELGDRRGEAESFLSIGRLYSNLGDYPEAKVYLVQARALAGELQVREIQRDALEALAATYAGTGEFRKALEAHQGFKRVHDELFNEEASRRLSELEASANLKAKNREIDALHARQDLQRLVRNISISGIVLLLLVIALLYNRYRLSRKTNAALRLAQAEKEKAARAELAHVARVSTLGEMTSALAHELNQPMTAILSNAQTTRRLVTESRAEPKHLQEALDDIISGAGRAREIIVRLRNLMRRGEVTNVRLSINDVVRAVEGVARANVQDKGIELELRLGDGLPEVEGDPIQLQQVTLNLVNNGAEAMAAGDAGQPLIVATTRDEQGDVVVAVRDAGPPIGGPVLEKMFDPFFTTKDEGLGMGLAICQTIIEAHGGSLQAVPNQTGGLTVSYALPAAGDEPA